MTRSPKPKKPNRNNPVPFEITFRGSIAESVARVFRAICRLIEGIVDWFLWKLYKNIHK